ncbi:hypothetical protein BKA64DRAFT_635908 [Cadophora sp. MPI-SDFR-AT-0126]|nr:hypothetical protein BKA64DRAFT_635908 [Leotiomycetes sp. MPI-SDFR-AT-0126]
MSNSKDDDEESYWNDSVSEPVNIDEGAVSPEEPAIDSEEQKEVSEKTDGLNDFENSPGIVLSLHEPMDVDSELPETVAESWADSMDDFGIDPSGSQNHTYGRGSVTAERQENTCEDYMPRQYTQRSRDDMRPRGSRFYHNRWNQSRASNWRGNGRVFAGQEPRDRYFRGRGFRNGDFRNREPRYGESRGGRRPYRYPQRFIPRGPSIWRSQARHDNYGLNFTLERGRRNLDRAGDCQYRWSDLEQ